MHEMALTSSLMELIRDQQRANGFQRVRRVVVEIGKLGHVEPRALDFAFAATSPGTPADGATLEIRELDGEAWCMDCASVVAVRRRGDGCPRCGGYHLIVQQGEELKLKELEVV